ncbi:MAG: TetR/AcrR family transcriptional regulator [Pseudomonadales bacterium]|nr:TetR/AcrR family transcriptional regulator [Pseudomonadales bacterium]
MNFDDKTEQSVKIIKEVLGLDKLQDVGIAGAQTRAKGALAAKNAKSVVLLNSMAVFTEKGIAETTVQDLLDAAKISRRTFYKYFRNKVDVLESIYKMSIELLIVRFKKNMSNSQNLGDVVSGCIDVYFDYHAELGSIIQMMQEEAMRSGSPLAPHRMEAQREMISIMDHELMRFQGGRIDPWAYYMLMWALENASMNLLTKTPCEAEDVNRCKNVLMGVASAVLVVNPEDRAPMPAAPEFGLDPFSRKKI